MKIVNVKKQQTKQQTLSLSLITQCFLKNSIFSIALTSPQYLSLDPCLGDSVLQYLMPWQRMGFRGTYKRLTDSYKDFGAKIKIKSNISGEGVGKMGKGSQ